MVARRDEAHAVGRVLGSGALARVVEARLAEHAKANLAPHGLGAPDHVVLAFRVLDQHEVRHLGDARGREEASEEHTGAWQIELLLPCPVEQGYELKVTAAA